jgi:hypothetical protein
MIIRHVRLALGRENFKTPAMLRGFPLFRTGSVAVGP